MSREEGSYLECVKCGGPIDPTHGGAVEGWPWEWVVAGKLRDENIALLSRLQRAEKVVERAKKVSGWTIVPYWENVDELAALRQALHEYEEADR